MRRGKRRGAAGPTPAAPGPGDADTLLPRPPAGHWAAPYAGFNAIQVDGDGFAALTNKSYGDKHNFDNFVL